MAPTQSIALSDASLAPFLSYGMRMPPIFAFPEILHYAVLYFRITGGGWVCVCVGGFRPYTMHLKRMGKYGFCSWRYAQI